MPGLLLSNEIQQSSPPSPLKHATTPRSQLPRRPSRPHAQVQRIVPLWGEIRLTSLQSLCFPTEVLDSIISYALLMDNSLSAIAGFSLASYRFRQIALRSFFSMLDACNPHRWDKLAGIRQLNEWVR